MGPGESLLKAGTGRADQRAVLEQDERLFERGPPLLRKLFDARQAGGRL